MLEKAGHLDSSFQLGIVSVLGGVGGVETYIWKEHKQSELSQKTIILPRTRPS